MAEETQLTGRRFRSLVRDSEEDDDYGAVEHPVGSIFVVGEPLHVERCDGDHGAKGHVCGQMYAVLWENAVARDGVAVPPEGCRGMWTIWSAGEIAGNAQEESTK